MPAVPKLSLPLSARAADSSSAIERNGVGSPTARIMGPLASCATGTKPAIGSKGGFGCTAALPVKVEDVSIKVAPFGADLATKAAPSAPPAPGLLSTTIAVPSLGA